MLIRLYSICVLAYDLTCFFIYTIFLMCTALIHIIKPKRLKRIDNDLALVIGSSGGIGKAIVYELAKCNTTIICLELEEYSLENDELVNVINNNNNNNNGNGNNKAYSIVCRDISDRECVQNKLNEINKLYGKITILFHCYSIPSPKNIIFNYNQSYDDQWKTNAQTLIRSTINTNILSYFWFLNGILPQMKRDNRGHIIFFTSVAGLNGIRENELPLAVTQFAVKGLYEAILEDLRMSQHSHDNIHLTLCHIYPFMISDEYKNDARSARISNYFGLTHPEYVAKHLIRAVLQNALEISIPWYTLYMSSIFKLLPKRAALMLRNIFDTGIDFC